MSALSDTAIVRHMAQGTVIIEPFDEQNLSTSSYDVTLGNWFWREQEPDRYRRRTYNPYSASDVRKVWGDQPEQARLASSLESQFGKFEGIFKDDYVILIQPGETILGHTREFIGGTGGIVTTMMKARSSQGRSFIEVCKCAGWGDVGYVNRWTMEITNNSRYYEIPLVVGRRIAQIVFFEVEKIRNADYAQTGKYQHHADLETTISMWRPENMLPRMYLDREAQKK